MNYIQRHYLKELIKLISNNLMDSPVSGDLDIVDNEIRLNIVGLVKVITMEYTGIINIQNHLPGGYSIKLNKSKRRIKNLSSRKLFDSGLLFKASGNFNIISCNVLCFNGDKFKANINDIDRDESIDRSNTNIEDETLTIREEVERESSNNKNRSSIDDDTVTNLFTTIPFEDGYTGYYNYHPREKVYLSGKIPDAYSKPLYKSRNQRNNKSFTRKINIVLDRMSKIRVSDRSVDVGDKPIELKKIAKAKEKARKSLIGRKELETERRATPTRKRAEGGGY